MQFLTLSTLVLCFIVVDGQLLTGHCDDFDNCARHGQCVNGSIPDSFWCRCDEGYGGEFCELECDLLCEAGQKCGVDEYGKAPMCIYEDRPKYDTAQKLGQTGCPSGYGGPDCGTRIHADQNPCDSNPCINGKCLQFAGGFQCVCDNGYGGSYCEQGQNHCANHSCSTGSRCINTMRGYHCECPLGKTGQYCEKVNCTLLGNTCNNGKCRINTAEDKGFECQCDPGFQGEFCNQDKNECLEKNICYHNSTCINFNGGYVCSCAPGFTGHTCNIPVDTCQEYECQNDGVCIRDSDQQALCYCKQGFTGKRCEIKCPSGFGGVNCNVALYSRVCSRDNGFCYNQGRCINKLCVCEPEFFGDRCEFYRKDFLEINSCRFKPCANNATCLDLNDSYICFCPPGFYGEDCQKRHSCTSTLCANGGVCEEYGSQIRCNCPPGFSGMYCEKKDRIFCSKDPCKNGGVCQTQGNGGVCECRYGHTGPLCEEKIVFDEPKETIFRDLCTIRNCSTAASNGVCNPECNLEECGFDGGDCSGGQYPFSKCLYSARCADLFANGVCNQECNNEECLYDGLDCQSELYRCPVKIRKHCIEKRADGVCNWECNSIGCGFDGGDCNDRTEAMILNDIRIKVQIDPVEFQKIGGETLMEISAQLRVVVRIQKDEYGALVFKWDGDKELERIEMDTQKLDELSVLSRRVRRSLVTGIVLYLEVEETCQVKTNCRFTTAQSVVEMIAASLSKSNGRVSLGLPITEAMVAAPRRTHTNEHGARWSPSQLLLFAVIAFLALGTVIAGVIVKTNEPEKRSRKRKMITAPVWIPPMENSTEKTRRNQSAHSSQRSLLENFACNAAPKRHRGEHHAAEATYSEGQHCNIYPQTLANGYPGEFSITPFNNSMEPVTPGNLTADEIPIHVQASGPDPISAPITFETVNQIDAKHKRRVLHWLAANARGKPEDMITSETVRCLEAGADVNARDCDENTALMLAVRARRVRLAVVLMRGGADPTIFNNSERSALHEAVINKDLRMLTNLLTDKRVLSEIDELDRNGMTALIETARSFGVYQVEMAKLLLSKGAKIDADGSSRKDSTKYHGRTALHYAALCGNLEMVEFLVSRNANKDKQDESGRTPLMLAAKEGREEVVAFLVHKGASLTTIDTADKNAAQIAKANYHYEIADYLTKIINERQHAEFLRQQIPIVNGNMKGGRTTLKAIKRAGSRKTQSSVASSRESNHLTPPPSDGSFSSPSPHYYATSSSTPTGMHSSPDYTYHQDMASTTTVWYPTPPPYSDPKYNAMLPNAAYSNSEKIDGSFYC